MREIGVVNVAHAVHIDHARLKDHVWGMDGRLEAQIQEGGEYCYLPFEEECRHSKLLHLITGI